MLSEILTEEMIVCDVEVSTWREAVVAVGEVLVNKNKVKQDFIR